MKGQTTDKKITVKTAAQILGVSTKSIHRYLTKGRLTKLKEGTRTLLLLPEVRSLESDPHFGQGRPSGIPGKPAGMGPAGDTVTLSRERYEQMLLELGEHRKQNQFFLEFKGIVLAREESLRRLEGHIEQLTERVLALETGKDKAQPTEPERLQRSAGEEEPTKTKPRKAWWQV